MFKQIEGGFEIVVNGQTIIHHTPKQPWIYIGKGNGTFNMYRGNFKIEDYLVERKPLTYCSFNQNVIRLSDTSDMATYVELQLQVSDNETKVLFSTNDDTINRYWFRTQATADEKFYGCGEQMSYFNLRGRNFPLWTSEPGVGRDKSTYVTWLADVKDQAGGDYYTTNYPEPTFVSSNKYLIHLDCYAYMDFNFKADTFVEMEAWMLPKSLDIVVADTFLDLYTKTMYKFGTQPKLPEWIYNGLTIGLQGGTKRVYELLEKTQAHGVKVNAIWAQDWQGKKVTSFGKRLFWDWQWSEAMYPELDKKIWELKKQGIRFMGYINPYLNNQGPLYKEALAKGYFATSLDGEEYVVDFGEFDCGVIDFTNPEAFTWYKELIKKNLIGFGLDGWMADFGEYLPTNLKLYNQIPAEIMHNEWPALWAKCNYEAVKEAGKLEEVVYFMRAGFTGNQKYCTLMWAGDQCCDFSLHDGLASVIPAALSCGMVGNGLHHSDIGGYTSLHGVIRSEELFERWVEMATFTPYMRTHEGNRPDENFQYYDSESCMKHLAKFTNIYTELAPYIKMLVDENATSGIPVQRPLFVHDEQDQRAYDIQYEYLLGADILVAPVYLENQSTWDVYLPKGEWIHFKSGTTYAGKQTVSVAAEIGNPPVFYRKGSSYTSLFEKVSKLF